jgi:hypothetical protein
MVVFPSSVTGMSVDFEVPYFVATGDIVPAPVAVEVDEPGSLA